MGIIILIAAVCILVIFLKRKNATSSGLRPFEFSGVDPSEERMEPVSSTVAGNNAIILLSLISTLPGIFYFLIDYFFGRSEFYYENINLLYRIVGGIINVALLLVTISLKNIRLKPLLVLLVLIQIALYIYNFLANQN